MSARGLVTRSLSGVLMLGSVIAMGSAIQASASTVQVCKAADLSGSPTGTGAGMSQPYVAVTVTNTGQQPCALMGYPVLTSAWTSKGKVAVSVKNGELMNMPSAAVRRLVLAPRAKAWFAIGSGTAYDSPLVTIRRIAFATEAGTSIADSSMLRVQIQATAPTGKAYPLGVTAFAKGSGPA